jgi:DNA-binding NarL/FixJ family response regulator
MDRGSRRRQAGALATPPVGGVPATPRVLVADDNKPLLDRVVSLLSREFDVVGTVRDGAELVAAEASLHPDVLVIDISMPLMSGLEAATQIRRGGSKVPMVYLTAHGERELLEAAWDTGALGYVTKSCVAVDLVPAIRAALEGRRYISVR